MLLHKFKKLHNYIYDRSANVIRSFEMSRRPICWLYMGSSDKQETEAKRAECIRFEDSSNRGKGSTFLFNIFGDRIMDLCTCICYVVLFFMLCWTWRMICKAFPTWTRLFHKCVLNNSLNLMWLLQHALLKVHAYLYWQEKFVGM